MSDEASTDVTSLTVQLLSAYLSNNTVPSDELPALIAKTRSALDETPQEPVAEERHEPAVSVRKSLASSKHLISLIDGKPYRTLRRHLTKHGLTPEEYRARYNLPADYPMVARDYSEHRRTLARSFGLGRKASPAAVEPHALPLTGEAAEAPAVSAQALTTKPSRPGKIKALAQTALKTQPGTKTAAAPKKPARKANAPVAAEVTAAPEPQVEAAPEAEKAPAPKHAPKAKSAAAASAAQPATSALVEGEVAKPTAKRAGKGKAAKDAAPASAPGEGDVVKAATKRAGKANASTDATLATVDAEAAKSVSKPVTKPKAEPDASEAAAKPVKPRRMARAPEAVAPKETGEVPA